jgi:multiple sugar transport system ATP-binding protein
MPDVCLTEVNKVYANGVHAVRDLTLEVELGEFLVLVGPSGCGKTTALRMVAGLEGISSGTIEIGERVVNDVSPRDRDIAMVFQNYALYPHMTVRENISYGLRMRRMPKDRIAERVERAARALDLHELLDRRPKQLSGGQRQRVAMGRAIVREPRVFLMDEPLSNLDARLRVQMRTDIASLQKQLGVTAIYVTHDQVEAMTMGDRVAVMRDGVLQQVAPPQELYDRPCNLFVAAFIGSPSMNLGIAELADADGTLALGLGDQRLALPPALIDRRPALRGYAGAQVAVGLRPEDMAHVPAGALDGTRLRARVELTEALGSELLVHFDVPVDHPDVAGATVQSQLPQQARATRWIASFRARSSVAIGDEVDVAVDPDRLHFFDLESGAAIWDDARP